MPRKPYIADVFLHALRQSLGRSTACRELRWMMEVASRRTVDDGNATFTNMVKARAVGQPLAYVVGDQPFGDLTIKCRSPTLIPRPETEQWAFRLIDLLNETPIPTAEPIRVLDICTGTGCIPLLLAFKYRRGPMQATGVDISPDAVHLARENIRNNPLPQGAVVGILDADFLDDFSFGKVVERGPFDVITCNPPYIPQAEYDQLPPSVKQYEDSKALIGPDSDGLAFYRRLVEVVIGWDLIKKGGVMAVEHGAGQSEGVVKLFERLAKHRPVLSIERWKDQWGKERCVTVRL